MPDILILFAHPLLEKSRVQRALASAARRVPGVTFRDLYEEYPDFDVDIREEQSLLLKHDIVVLQHPLYWYSCPALLKQWIDLVLEHGWAYGRNGKALAGKTMLNAISAGGGETAYTRTGLNRWTIREFLVPFEQTATLCNMEYLPPFVVHGTHRAGQPDIATQAGSYARVLEALAGGKLDAGQLKSLTYLNEVLPTVQPREVPR